MSGGKTLRAECLGRKSPHDFFSIFLDPMHYWSPSGGGGWHSLYNLIIETHMHYSI